MNTNQNTTTMKTPIFIVLFIVLLSTGFIGGITEQDYVYHLTIRSINKEEQKFDLEITSKSASSSEEVKTVLSNQTTPFERNLESGEHVIVVEHIGEQGAIISKVVGILGVKHMGAAASEDKVTILRAGPGGRYSAGK